MIQRLRNGRCFNISDKAHKDWWEKTYPNWEHGTSKFMDTHCRPDKVTLDIGAWNGVHTLYMAMMSKKVYALEPDPRAFDILLDNVLCNPALRPLISTLPIALSNICGRVRIMNGGGSGSSIIKDVQAKHPSISTVEVRCITFRQLLADLGVRPDEIGFIKMDIEGAESMCIPDMEWFLKDYRGAICLSLHEGFMPDEAMDNIVQIMSRYFIQVSGSEWIWRAG